MAVEGTYPFQRGAGAADDKTIRTVLASDSPGAVDNTELMAKLDEIIDNTGNIEISAESVNLNTDTLEALIAAGNASLTNIDGYVAFISDDQLASIKTDASETASNTTSIANDISDFVTTTFGLQAAVAETDPGQSATTMAFIKGLVSLNVDANIIFQDIYNTLTGSIETHLQELETNTSDLQALNQPLEDIYSILNTNIATIESHLDSIRGDIDSVVKQTENPYVAEDFGIPALAVRKDTPVALTVDDGDYHPLEVSGGRLWCSTLITGDALTALQLIDDIVLTDDAAFTPATSKVAMAGFQADETATDSVDEGDAGAARMTLDRKQIVTEYAHTTGGEESYTAISTAAVISAEIKGSPGQVYSMQFFNNGANEVFVRLYNQTGAPGTGDGANLIWRGMVPGNTAGAGFVVAFPVGKRFSTGIGIRVTGAVGTTDATALVANEVLVNVGYK